MQRLLPCDLRFKEISTISTVIRRLRSPLQELRQISRDTICKFLIYPFELISFKISIKIKNLSFARFRSVIRRTQQDQGPLTTGRS